MSLSKASRLENTKRRVRDAFILFEHKEGSKLVDIKDVPTVIRSLGVNPTQAQTQMVSEQLQILNEHAEHSSSLIGIEHFVDVVSTFLVQQEAALFRDDYHTLIRAFRAFDPEGKGYIDAEHLKALLGSKGEPLSDDDQNKMVAFAADDDGKIFYEDYAHKLCSDGRSI